MVDLRQILEQFVHLLALVRIDKRKGNSWAVEQISVEQVEIGRQEGIPLRIGSLAGLYAGFSDNLRVREHTKYRTINLQHWIFETVLFIL